MADTPLLEARGIRKRFPGTLALDGVTLSIMPGEIHAVMGENGAGKSTLLNILTGSLSHDEGEIFIKGMPVQFKTPIEARQQGLAIVHQELSLFPDVSVMENVLAGMTPSRFGLMNRKQMAFTVREYLARFEVGFKPETIVKDLSVSQQQVVEIVKALVTKADIFIFDEPTSALSVEDAERLFVVLRELRSEGKAVVYVSHKFDEIFRLSDRVSVLRDGQMIGTKPIGDLTSDEVIRMMVGRSLERIYPEKGSDFGEKILEVSGLEAGWKCQNVSFELFKGEILGVFGLVGSGRTEIMRALTGIDPKLSGNVSLFGKSLRIRSIQDAISHGIYYLTEDRKLQGLFLQKSIRDDVASVHLEGLNRHGLFERIKAATRATEVMQELRVKAASENQLVGSLSGGNQQKVMIGKWLKNGPQILILDEPTRGIDVGAKAEIHQLLRRLTQGGMGVIVISSELPEIVGLSDRVLVVHKGTISGVLEGSDINDEIIMQYASGLHKEELVR
ncbi:sugar ABC transporter ATP-binding protein [Alicyclobacillus curvatus]|nr:sugar ABC transporter ATP-binding protein [Alicyclobacillus curvatus]